MPSNAALLILASLMMLPVSGSQSASAPIDQPAASPSVSFRQSPGKLQIDIGRKPFATYVWDDPTITRPYFSHLHVAGIQVTRNHPPREGDPKDHATFHPGLWLAFGDLSGNDYWRNKAKVAGGDFIEKPRGGPGRGSFTVRNRYLSTDGQLVCTEICRYTILVEPIGDFLLWDSKFSSEHGDFVFGDQEEMGLGVRLATPIAVDSGNGGRILDSQGRENGKEIWGKTARWCDYSGTVDGKLVGVTLMPHPDNFRPSWWHARDYGLLAANPFGRKAFTQGEASHIVVKKGESFRLRFGVLFHATESKRKTDLEAGYRTYLQASAE